MIQGKVKEKKKKKKNRKQEMFCSKYEWKHNLFKFEYVYKAEKVHKKLSLLWHGDVCA